MNNLSKRILVAAAGIPITVGAVWLGGPWFVGYLMIVSAFALYEFYSLSAGKGAAPQWIPGIIIGAGVQLFVAAMMLTGGTTFLMLLAWQPLVLLAGVLLVLTVELFRGREHPIINVAATLMGVAYVAFGLAPLIAIRERIVFSALGVNGGRWLVVTLLVTIWTCDSAAYFVGMRFGKHKLFYRVSPGKSWEGAVAGFVAASAAFAGMSAWLLPTMPVAVAVGAGMLVGTIGQIGDLVESLFKRDAEIKDSSNLIPGHGGFLDRFDSLLFAAPALLIYLAIVYW